MGPQELCLDANIFLAAWSPEEPFQEVSLKLLRQIERHRIPLFEPAVVLFEITSVIHRKIYLKELNRELGQKMLDLFLELPLLLLWQPKILRLAERMANELSVKRINDCSYLAVASDRDIPLVTLDTQLLKNGQKFLRKVMTPELALKSFG